MTLVPLRLRLALLRVGWIGLVIGVGMPFAASVLAIALNRWYESRCRGEKAFTLAPLVYRCGDINPVEFVVGWSGTVLTIVGIVAAIVGSVAALALGLMSERSAAALAPTIHLAATIALAVTSVAVVLLTDPLGWVYPGDSWSAVLLGSAVGVAACIAGAVVGGLARLIIRLALRTPSA